MPDKSSWKRCETWAVAIWAVCLVVVCIRVALRPGSGSVYPCYAEAGQRWLAGQPVYQDPHGYRYSPSVTPLFAALSLLPDRAAEVLWRLFSAAVYLGALAWWTRLLPLSLTPAQKAVLFLLTVPLSLGSLNNGQANLLVAGLLVGGVAATIQEHWTLASVFLVVPCLFKVYPAVIALLVLALYPRKLALRLSGALAVGLALPFLVQQPGRVFDQYAAWIANLNVDDRTAWPLEHGYRDLWQLCRLWHVPLSHGGYLAVQLVCAVGVATICLAGRRAGWPSRRLLATVLALGSSWMMLFGPATESSTFVMLAPPLAWAVLESWITRPSSWTRGSLVVAYGLFLAAFIVNWFPFVLRAHALGLHPLATLIFFGTSLSLAGAGLRRSHRAAPEAFPDSARAA
jgi:hypothetical protein